MVKMPAYPRELKAAEWQKNKGQVAKLKGKSGISELLKKAESEYTKVIKTHHDNQIAACTDNARVRKVVEISSNAWRSFLDTLGDTKKLATTRAKEYKSSKFVGKTTRQYVESIAAKADEGGKFGNALNEAHMGFVQACQEYLTQPSVIGGDITMYMKEANAALPKFEKVVAQLSKLNNSGQDISDPLTKFCSSLRKFAKETSRSLGQALISYCQVFDKLNMKLDPKLAELIKLWGEHGKFLPTTLEEASSFVEDGQTAYNKSLAVLRPRGFKV